MIGARTESLAGSGAVVFGLLLAATIALVAGLLLPVRPAHAQAVPDADCPGPPDVRVSGSARTAQTFTAESGGELTGVQAVVANGDRPSGGNYVLTINEVDDAGIPTNAVLASALVQDSQVPDNAVLTTINGDFVSPPEVLAGREYALVVQGPEGFSVGIRTGDQCPGKRYSSSSGTGAFSEGAVGEDLVFATFVDPFEPFTVNFPDDFADARPGDGLCDVNEFLAGLQCTLRAAIQETNTTAFADTINFDIAGDGVRTISPDSELPEITEPLTIDGYTQPGASPNTKAVGNDAVLKIELSGQDAGFEADGLRISAPDVTVRGLVVNRFRGRSIASEDATGTRIEGNFIGTDASGTQGLGSAGGVFMQTTSGSTVGGTSPEARNVICNGSGFGGVRIEGDTDNKVLGNYLGTDSSGTRSLENCFVGVSVGGSNNTIGGTQPGAGNLVSGNSGTGVVIFGHNNEVSGNLIGTNVAGTGALANGEDDEFDGGVILSSGASGNVVTDNVISGNRGFGVRILHGDGNEVSGNLIGTKKDGVSPLGNSGSGVLVGPPENFSGARASGNTVGGAPEDANTIAFNGADGVGVKSNFASPATGNRILSNSIYANADLGIDLADDGPTPNDFGDLDTGPNDLQNFPELASARTSRTSTVIKGELRSAPGQVFTVRFFSNPSGTDEGKKFIGQKRVTTNGDGIGSFSLTLKGTKKVPRGQNMTATATDSAGNTSEFSAPRRVVRQR